MNRKLAARFLVLAMQPTVLKLMSLYIKAAETDIAMDLTLKSPKHITQSCLNFVIAFAALTSKSFQHQQLRLNCFLKSVYVIDLLTKLEGLKESNHDGEVSIGRRRTDASSRATGATSTTGKTTATFYSTMTGFQFYDMISALPNLCQIIMINQSLVWILYLRKNWVFAILKISEQFQMKST